MSSLTNEIQVPDIDHLGIVTGIVDEIGLVEQVDALLGTHPQEVLNLGQVLKVMILNGLGFVSAPLYLFSQFFEGKATAHLLGEGIEAQHLNDDRLGRAIDRFYEYGVTKLFTTLALAAARKFGVETKRVHLDSSSMSVEGQYVEDEESTEWEGLQEGYRLIELGTKYAQVPQRWVVVESDKRREADLKQFKVG